MAADLVEQFSDEEIDGDLRVLANTSACVDLGDARPYLKRVLATIDDRDREIAELRHQLDKTAILGLRLCDERDAAIRRAERFKRRSHDANATIAELRQRERAVLLKMQTILAFCDAADGAAPEDCWMTVDEIRIKAREALNLLSDAILDKAPTEAKAEPSGYHSCDGACCEKVPGKYCADDDCNCGAAGNHAAETKAMEGER